MKVKTLIKKLQKLNPNQKIVIRATGSIFGVDVFDVQEKLLSQAGNIYTKREAKDWEDTTPVASIEGMV